MKIIAPGKLILSGEHSVVYGHPALAMAVNRYVTARVENQDLPLISLDISELSYEQSLTVAALTQLKNHIKDKYQKFVSGQFSIREVLQKPFELAQFALGLGLDMLSIKLTQGMKIRINSTIPIGCGMGSSAATILSIMHTLASYAGVNVPAQKIYEMGLQAENMQHGVSSGLDLYVSLHGGCCYAKDKVMTAKPMPEIELFLVNTGNPLTTTGECVTSVAKHFKLSSIGDAFADVTNAMMLALESGDVESFRRTVYANHELLLNIGVVPDRVRTFMHEIHRFGGVGKVCGAGAIAGDQAGIVMVHTDNMTALQTICDNYGYDILPIKGETRGVHVDV